MDDASNVAALAQVIAAQVDLVWSLALALVVAEVLALLGLVRSTAGAGSAAVSRRGSRLASGSVAFLTASMVAGYLVYGSVTQMTVAAMRSDAALVETTLDDAEMAALLQFVCFMVGFLVGLGAVVSDPKLLDAILPEKSNE